MVDKPRGLLLMADKKGRELKADAFIERMVSDPAELPNVSVLVGSLGRSAQPRHYRLYVKPELDEFYEISEDDILQTEQRESAQPEFGTTTLWVRRDATITHCVRTKPRQKQADFLKGLLVANHLRYTGVTGLVSRDGGDGIGNKVPTWVICAVSPMASIIIVESLIPDYC